ncbi:hypothetical protein P43SY_005994 [Pythium insidiosum]|uniref:Methionyl/Leucyl tRNA synthetase domain-containing protein n=1 Tax=Pythium insidiosum TaxID=114742 RepID=A0AAD5LTY7_PYTIN|nr:hypothetical protein P43SY_005994 [Pythium insidiosum]
MISVRWRATGFTSAVGTRPCALLRARNAPAAVAQSVLRRWSSVDSSSAQKAVYITTPIFYVNASPHIGHVHSAVLADALARWHSIKGEPVVFTTGTDEHGLKVQEAAEKAGTTDYQAFCDDVSSRFNTIFQQADVAYSRFIRTSDRDHHEAVTEFWRAIERNGHIYLGEHEAWYCKSDEAFLTETQVEDVVDPATGEALYKVSKESGHRVEKFREENYKFRLSAFQDALLAWLDANPDVIVPRMGDRRPRRRPPLRVRVA